MKKIIEFYEDGKKVAEMDYKDLLESSIDSQVSFWDAQVLNGRTWEIIEREG